MLTTIRRTSRLVTCRDSVVYKLEPPCSIIAKWNAAAFAIACIRDSCRVLGGTGAGVFGGVSVSFNGSTGWFLMVTACRNVAPKSGLASDRYRRYQLVSTLVPLRRFVSRRRDRSAPFAWLPLSVRNGSRLTGCAPLETR